MEKTKILFVHGGTLKKAGTETFMMSVFRNIDKSKFHIDFLVFGETPGDYDQEVIEAGAKIFRFPLKISNLLHPTHLRTLNKSIQFESYDIVHAHMNALNYPILKHFKKMGIKTLISHSHGSKHFVENKLLITLKERWKRKIPSVTTHLLACSKAAGDFLYESTPYELINNGVDTTKYQYNPMIRKAYRESMNLDNKFIYGHIGRFNFQKNHKFLIDVFRHIKNLDDKAHLILVGEGELEKEIVSQINNLGLQEHVTLLGVRDDIPELLQMMDGFIMPSVFEGLPYVLVEAQASGLQCFAADTIDSQSKILNSFFFLPLDCPQNWAQFVILNRKPDHIQSRDILIDKGFDVYENVRNLESYYKKKTL